MHIKGPCLKCINYILYSKKKQLYPSESLVSTDSLSVISISWYSCSFWGLESSKRLAEEKTFITSYITLPN